MPVIYEQHQGFVDFANDILQLNHTLDSCKTITQLSDKGTIECVVLFTRASEFDIHLSIASNGKWRATKSYLTACYHYVFNTCGKRRLTVIIEEDNLLSIKFNERMGHIFEGKLLHLFGDKHGLIYRLLKEECKCLNM